LITGRIGLTRRKRKMAKAERKEEPQASPTREGKPTAPAYALSMEDLEVIERVEQG